MSESRFRTHARGSRLRRGLVGATTLALASFALAACESDASPGPAGTTSEVSSSPTPRPDPVRVTSNLRDGAATESSNSSLWWRRCTHVVQERTVPELAPLRQVFTISPTCCNPGASEFQVVR